MNPKPFRVIPCAEWHAQAPRGAISGAGKPSRIIFHHTAGHHPELDGVPGTETYAESEAYAKAVQQAHFHNGWVDSGHNFLVTRAGYIFEGRHGSLAAVKAGKMVVSAHCPGQNEQPGIEHEQIDPEGLTPIQLDATVWLHAWICKQTGIDPKHIDGHRDHYATACPGVLYALLPKFRQLVATELGPSPKPKPKDGYWQVTKTFYDGRASDPEKAKSVRAWANKAGDLHDKGVRDLRFHWVETA